MLSQSLVKVIPVLLWSSLVLAAPFQPAAITGPFTARDFFKQPASPLERRQAPPRHEPALPSVQVRRVRHRAEAKSNTAIPIPPAPRLLAPRECPNFKSNQNTKKGQSATQIQNSQKGKKATQTADPSTKVSGARQTRSPIAHGGRPFGGGPANRAPTGTGGFQSTLGGPGPQPGSSDSGGATAIVNEGIPRVRARKAVLTAAGATQWDMAIAFQETSNTSPPLSGVPGPNYPFGDGKRGANNAPDDSSNFSLFKLNWFTIRTACSAFAGLRADQADKGAVLNNNESQAVKCLHEAMSHFRGDFYAVQRSGSTGLVDPASNAGDWQGYVKSLNAIFKGLAGHLSDDFSSTHQFAPLTNIGSTLISH